jgi:hypothetical protein
MSADANSWSPEKGIFLNMKIGFIKSVISTQDNSMTIQPNPRSNNLTMGHTESD